MCAWTTQAHPCTHPHTAFALPALVYVDVVHAEFVGAELCESLPSPTEPHCRYHLDEGSPVLPGWQCPGDQTLPCFGKTGEQVLNTIGYLYPTVRADVDVWQSIGVLLVIAGVFKLLFFLVVWYLTWQSTTRLMPASPSSGPDVPLRIFQPPVGTGLFTQFDKPSRNQKTPDLKTASPTSPVLAFRNIRFVVPGRRQYFQCSTGGLQLCTTASPKVLLQDISGAAHGGKLLGILGPSGAGKTTLLNVLINNASYGRATGQVQLQGEPMTPGRFFQHCVVVPQKDQHWAFLRTREVVSFAARLFLGSMSTRDRDQRVYDILEEMGLSAQAESFVGNDFLPGGISSGEKRRLSVAVACIKQTMSVLFLDEPTTGLDAAAASNMYESTPWKTVVSSFDSLHSNVCLPCFPRCENKVGKLCIAASLVSCV